VTCISGEGEEAGECGGVGVGGKNAWLKGRSTERWRLYFEDGLDVPLGERDCIKNEARVEGRGGLPRVDSAREVRETGNRLGTGLIGMVVVPPCKRGASPS